MYHISDYCLWGQRLEDSVLRGGEEYTIRGIDGSPAKIPARVREIITKNLSGEELTYTPSSMAAPTVLQEENRLLSSELNRVEDLLAASKAERDELSIKYNALSERVSLKRLLVFFLEMFTVSDQHVYVLFWLKYFYANIFMPRIVFNLYSYWRL